MSIKRKVSIKIPVFQFIEDIGLDKTRMTPLLKRWCVEADRDIGSYYAYKRKICVLDVNECTAELPCSAVGVLAWINGDHGCDCGLLFKSCYQTGIASGYATTGLNGFEFVDVVGHQGSCQCIPVGWEIQNNNIVFNKKFPADSKITVQYLGYEEDAEGFPLINENHLTAMSAHMEWRLAKQSRWKPTLKTQNENAIKEMERTWNKKCRQARADDAQPSESERREIVAMVNDPMSGIGLIQWSLSDNWYGIGIL
jgi:hypothetical protein